MKVIVQIQPTHVDEEPKLLEFDNAAGWHIDEERQLHIKKSGDSKGHLAAFATNTWMSVREDQQTASD